MEQNREIIFNELVGVSGGIGQIILNRPQVLNALSLAMCDQLLLHLEKWQQSPKINAVIIKGNGDRAFCAGGDIRALYHALVKQPREHVFFNHEYRMNETIFNFPKPYISLLNGITMGGGAGISIHGSHRVATEKFTFAMPETNIGFFPDIGAGYFLTRLPDYVGYYLGLTGQSIGPADAYDLGLITQIVESQQLATIEKKLLTLDLTIGAAEAINQLLDEYQIVIDPSQKKLTKYRSIIAKHFAKNSVEEIIESLQQDADPWCSKAAAELLTKSPTSLKVTFKHLRRSEKLSFSQIIAQEAQIARHFLRTHDFFEGVRAALIDKDRKPQWQPNLLSAVSDKMVKSFFD